MHSLKPQPRRMRLWPGLLGLVALSLVVAPLQASADSPSAVALSAGSSSASVTVNAGDDLGPVPAHPFGINQATWDSHMNDSVIPGLMKTAGITAMRYPGGSWSDSYDWQTNSLYSGGSAAPNTNFTDFMATARSAGAMPIITVNYGSGTPALAAAWVKDANVTNNYGITYWEVGNEVYGNGFYGSGWEEDSHSSKSPDTYAANFLQYQSAMRAVDPNIKVCTVLTLPGNWPDGDVGPGDTMDWNHTVLKIVGANLQCVIVHDYPGGSSPAAAMLRQPASVTGWMATLRSEINEYAGSAAASTQVLTTETDSNGPGLDSQPGALYAADTMMSMLEGGSVNVDYWNEHNGGGSATSVDGVPDYNDEGMFSNGGGSEPAANTPFAPYYAVEMLSRLAAPGDEMIESSSSSSLVRVHAVQTSSGAVDLLVENEDPANSYTVSLNYSGFTPSGSPAVSTFSNGGQSIASGTQGSTSSVTVAPYSLTVLKIASSSSSSGGTGGTGTGSTGPGTGSTGPGTGSTGPGTGSTGPGTGSTGPGTGSTSTSSAGSNGSGPIVSAYDTGKCVDDNGDSAAEGTAIQVWDCNGGSAQGWTLAANGTIQDNGKCVDILGGGSADKTAIDLWDCNGGTNQQWSKGTDGTLVNPASGKCLEDPSYDTADGTQLEIFACNGGANQQWKVPAAPVVSFYDPGKCMDDNGDSAAAGTAVQMWDCNAGAAQGWVLATDGTIQDHGMCLDAVRGGTADATGVDLAGCSGAASQRWAVHGDTLVSAASGKCLDDPAYDTADGTQLHIYTCNGGTNQMWTMP